MTPTPTTAGIDAETMAAAREALNPGFFDEGTSTEIKGYPTILKRVARAIQAAKAEERDRLDRLAEAYARQLPTRGTKGDYARFHIRQLALQIRGEG